MTALPSRPTKNWLSNTLARNPDFVFRRIDDEGILLPIRANVTDDNRLYSLNPTAARIWELMDGTRTGKQIRDLMMEEYETTDEQLTQDIEALVNMLSGVGGVTVGEEK
ncbi:MAG TPA: PqqD family protein [Bdellovibrionota bacterium]|nr:PqqD family protein [Bdellovibrionota bacterium]